MGNQQTEKTMPAIHARNLICICIDRIDHRDYVGRLWHQYQDEPIAYNTTMEMIQAMDGLYDLWQFPQRSTQVRMFGAEVNETTGRKEEMTDMDEKRLSRKSGDIGTFIVRVKYRQNATWQGEVVWAEKQERRYFRSALELLKLIDGALEETENGPPGAAPEEPQGAG